MPSSDAFPDPMRVATGEVGLSVHAAGAPGAPLVVLLHGWPELAYSWRRQIGPLAAAGFRVVAPDLRGFGASDAPEDVAAYGIDHLVADVEALVDHEGAERAVLVGHDWGGVLAWHFAMLRPERTAGVAALCTPHLPRGGHPPTEVMRHRDGDEHYIVRFQQPGAAEAVFEADLDGFFRFIFTPPPTPADSAASSRPITHLVKQFEDYDPSAPGREPVVGEADRAVFVAAYRRTGFASGMNWYRNLDANWARMDGVDDRVSAPCLMISAERDPILPPHLTRWMDALTPDLERAVLPGVGHWVQWEAPERLNEFLGAWLERRFGGR